MCSSDIQHISVCSDDPTPMEYRIPQYITVVKKEAVLRQDVQRVVVHAAVTEIMDDAFRG